MIAPFRFLPEPVGDEAQELVALLLAPERVVGMELIDVEADERKGFLRVRVQQLSCLGEKRSAVIQIGQRVVLIDVPHLTDQIVLAAGDDVLEPCPERRRLVRLGYEIPGAEI